MYLRKEITQYPTLKQIEKFRTEQNITILMTMLKRVSATRKTPDAIAN